MSEASGPRTDVEQTTIEKQVVGASYDRTVEEVAAEFDALDPNTISSAAVAWRNAGDRLGVLASTLMPEVAEPLSAVWSGDASVGPQNQLRMAHATVQELANQCMQMANAMNWAAEHAEWYKSNQPDVGITKKSVVAGAVTTVLTGGNVGLGTAVGLAEQKAEADRAATQHLERFMERYNEIIGILPDQVSRELLVADPGVITDGPGPQTGGGGPGSTLAPKLPGDKGTPGRVNVSSGGGVTDGPADAIGHPTGGAGPGSGPVSGTGPAVPGVVPVGSGGAGPGGLPDPYAAGSLLAGGGNGGGLGDLLSLSGASGPGAGGVGGGLGGGLGGDLGMGAVAVGGLGAAGVALGVSGFGGAGLGGAGFGGAGFGGSGLGSSGLGMPGRAGSGLSSLPGGGGSGLAGRPGTAAGLGARAGGAPGEFPGTVSPSGSAGGAAAGAGRGGMAPMQGNRGGEGDEDERSTWLTEDDDVWTDGRRVPPPLITE